MADGAEVKTYKVWHYGYHPRTLPCTADQANCDYLDALWEANDLGMVYSGIFWLVAGAVLLIIAVGRRSLVSRRTRPFVFTSTSNKAEGESSPLTGTQLPSSTSPALVSRPLRAAAATARSYLLPDSIRFVFGRTTRLQVLILTILVVYLTIFSFVGMTYALWISPVKDHPGVYKEQNTAGIWSNRIGILAYAITPFSVLLASRESILSILTGVPYQAFNFLHRWVGYIILLQSVLHAIVWCVICIGLYGPQPEYAVNWVTKEYMVYGLCAMFLLLLMWFLSLGFMIRLTGFEFFRKTHYVLAMVYIGTCWGHWEFLGDWMLCGLLLWFFDRLARLVRMALLHHQYVGGDWGFHPAQAQLTLFSNADHGDVARLDFTFSQSPWHVGQHFYLCFPDSSVWQSHPFTPLSLPVLGKEGLVKHSYVFRAKGGETKKIAELAAHGGVNVLAIAGGTGITYVLPVILETLQSQVDSALTSGRTDRAIQLIWMVRHRDDARWIESELECIKASAGKHNVQVTIFVTREQEEFGKANNTSADEKLSSDQKARQATDSSSSSSFPDTSGTTLRDIITYKNAAGSNDSVRRHPDVGTLVQDFVGETVQGPTVVFASGPGAMISELRTSVASLNSGKQVWRGNERWDVELREDNRTKVSTPYVVLEICQQHEKPRAFEPPLFKGLGLSSVSGGSVMTLPITT
ncbi:Ferric reductase transmembrane component 5 like protein [Verticillium longisporum]|nr:Ferric reductase transmembrane component 5 like protein [Verticillium longisporum]